MSKLSEEYLKILKDIEEKISDKDERNYVIGKMSELSSLYMEIIDRITDVNSKRMENLEKHQEETDTKLSKVKNTVDLIKKDIYEDDDYDFKIVCPYCNHEFVADVEDELKEEIECPECHNIIELDWDEDNEDGCSGCCSSCHGHDGCDDEDDDEEDKNEKDDDKKDEDDDM